MDKKEIMKAVAEIGKAHAASGNNTRTVEDVMYGAYKKLIEIRNEAMKDGINS